MFRRLVVVGLVVLWAMFVRPAAAQRSVPRITNLAKLAYPGYSEQELAAEKKLLAQKSKPITWDRLPLLQFPRAKSLPGTEEYWAQFGIYKPRELTEDEIEAARKKFVEKKLKDKTFAGAVRIVRKDGKGTEYTIYANEVARPAMTVNYSPPSFAYDWPPYACQWRTDSERGFPVGENVDIVGKIEDLKEELQDKVRVNTLFLKSVVVVGRGGTRREMPDAE